MHALLRRLRYWISHRRIEADLADELVAHHALQQEALERQGMPAVEAAAAAYRVLGNVTLAREDSRSVWVTPWIESCWQDVRISLRALRKRPALSAVIVMTMALGIGANTAVFSLLDSTLFHTLPVSRPDRIVFFSQTDSTGGGLDFSHAEFERLRDASHSFATLVAYDGTRFSAVADGKPSMATGDFVSAGYFALFGGRPMEGRTLTPADDQPGASPAVVISASYRARAFGTAAAVGRVITIGAIPFTVVGVMRPTFRGRRVSGSGADLTIPLAFHPQLALRDHQSFGIAARLRQSVELAQATADVESTHRRFLADSSGTGLSPAAIRDITSRRIQLRPGLHGADGGLTSSGLQQTVVVTGIVALVLLIACINVASLLVARAADRQKEMAVRLSIGAGRGRLVRQLLTESMVLAGAGGIVGLFCSASAAGLLRTMLPLNDLTFSPLTSPACLAFTAILAIGTGVLFGLAPAIASTRVNLSPILRGADTGRAGARHVHIGGVLVVAQIALSLTLLVAAGLLLQSLRQLHRTEPGFAADHVAAAYVYPVLLGESHGREMLEYQAMLDRLLAIRGVRSASVMRYWIGSTTNVVGPGFFTTLGIPFVRGRDFSETIDRVTSQKVAILSAAAARVTFGNDDPIGRLLPNGDFAGAQVIGVVRDIRHSAWQETGDATVYAPYMQADSSALGQIQLMVRTTGDPARSFGVIGAAVRSVEPNLPIVSLQTVAETLGQSVAAEASIATLLSGFGGLALLLALIGLYGTISHSVASRTREIGIRMSLGAGAGDIVCSILAETLRLIGIGILVGLGLALGASRLLGSLLFHTAPTDPVVLAEVVALTVVIGLVAGSIPAYRAARVSPLVALRHG